MQKQVGRYMLIQEIGEGQFGKVYKALDTENNNNELAVKVIPKEKAVRNPQVWKLLQSEIEIMKNLHHPHLLNLVDFLGTASNYYMVMPFCRDGDLEKRVKKQGRIEEREAVYYLKQIMSGFVYLYQHKIMHRDFKLANVFINGDQLIIGDFGFSKQGVDVANTKLGTPFNMAPEIMFSTGRSYYTSKADLWAIGTAYYHMLFGTQPFQANSMGELQNLVVNCSGPNVRFPHNIQVSEESKNLIRGLLEFDHNKRMNWQQFFNHPLFDKFTEEHHEQLHDHQQFVTNHANPSATKLTFSTIKTLIFQLLRMSPIHICNQNPNKDNLLPGSTITLLPRQCLKLLKMHLAVTGHSTSWCSNISIKRKTRSTVTISILTISKFLPPEQTKGSRPMRSLSSLYSQQTRKKIVTSKKVREM